MRVTRLELGHMRRFTRAALEPGPGLNLITGDNGAGKTTLLEALHLMAYARSFRGRVQEGLIQAGAEALEVFVEWQEAAMDHDSRIRRAGLRHSGQTWEGRLDGASVGHLGELCAALVVVTVEPGSHTLVTGSGEGRRRFLDWGLFHVEPAFLPLWRRYARALKQRNALLKLRCFDPQMAAWEHELAASGELISAHRERYLEALQPLAVRALSDLLPAAGHSALSYQPGWRRDEVSLADALLLARDRDLASGFTSVGPHRADWRLDTDGIPGRSALSRGQAKLAALSLLLGQATHHAEVRGEWPVVALDDLASELDAAHQRRVLDQLVSIRAQVFITGTDAPRALDALAVPVAAFHVEQGSVRAETGLSGAG